MKTNALYAALDLHSSRSVLGSMDEKGNSQGRVRFATEAGLLREQVQALRKKARKLYLTLEAGALTRWAVGIIRPLVDRLIVCEPRHNRLINSNPNKCDEVILETLWLIWLRRRPFDPDKFFPTTNAPAKKAGHKSCS